MELSVPGYIIAQIAGELWEPLLAYLTYKVQMDEEPDAGTKLGVFSTGPSINALSMECSNRNYGNNISC